MAWGPQHWDPTRPSGYPFLLLALAKVTHGLAVATSLQHLAGLVLVALVYWVGLRIGLGIWLAAAVALIVGLDAWLIALEQSLMAEAVFGLATVAAVAATVAAGDGRPWLLAVAAVLLAFACMTRAAGLFVVPAWFAYVVWRHRAVVPVAAAALAFALPLGVYVAKYHSAYGARGLTAAGGWFRYGRVAQLADCSRFQPPAGTEPLCESASERRTHRPIFYLWNEASPARQLFGEPSADRRANEMLGRFARDVVKSRPLAYARVVASDTGAYFVPGRHSPGSSDIALSFPEQPRGGPFVNVKVRDRYLPSYEPAAHPPASALRAYASVFHLPRFLLGLAGLAAVAQALAALRPRWRHALPHTAEVLLLAGMALAMLLGSTASSAFVVRYLVPAAPLLLLAGAAATKDLLAARRA